MLIACLSCRTQCHNQLWLGIQVAIIYSLSTMGSCELLYIAFFSMFQNMHGNYILQLFYTLPIVYLVKTRPPWNLLNVIQIVLASLVVCHISKLPAQVHIWFIMKCIHTSQHLLVDIDVVHSVTSVASDRAFGKLWNEKPMSAFIVLFQNIVRNSVVYSQNSFVASSATGRVQKLDKFFTSR